MTLIVYHRGGGKSLDYPPNSIPALKWAISQKAKAIEFDVVAAREGDKHQIAIVEPSVIELAGLNLDNLTWTELTSVNMGNDAHGLCKPTLLSDLLMLTDVNVAMQIHIKGKNPLTPSTLVGEIKDEANKLITSFDISVLRAVKVLNPKLKLGWIVKPDNAGGTEGAKDLTKEVSTDPDSLPSYSIEELEQIMELAEGIDAVILCGPRVKSTEPINKLHKAGFEVGAGGVGSNLDIARKLINFDIDRLTIDNPEEL